MGIENLNTASAILQGNFSDDLQTKNLKKIINNLASSSALKPVLEQFHAISPEEYRHIYSIDFTPSEELFIKILLFSKLKKISPILINRELKNRLYINLCLLVKQKKIFDTIEIRDKSTVLFTAIKKELNIMDSKVVIEELTYDKDFVAYIDEDMEDDDLSKLETDSDGTLFQKRTMDMEKTHPTVLEAFKKLNVKYEDNNDRLKKIEL